MLRRLRQFFRFPDPLDPQVIGERVRDVHFRVMEEADIGFCLSLYRANEAAHFPLGLFDYYAGVLRRGEFLTLIAERDDRPVGCCGLQYHGPGQAALGFSMVAPAHQRQGIGTAQLLVRLALITPSVHGTATVAMTAVPNSLPFYRRFGFASMGNLPAADGNTYPTAILRLNSARIHACRKLLAARGITFPEVGARIPFPVAG